MSKETFIKRFIRTKEDDQRYELVAVLGEGGMARVYLGIDHLEGREVAVKYPLNDLYPNPEVISRFRREMKVMSRLAHPHVVQCLDQGLDEMEPGCFDIFYVMEFFDGVELSDLIHHHVVAQGKDPITGTLLPFADIGDILLQLLDALGAIHKLGLVHRDVKPQNILWRRQPNGRLFIKLSDFGVVKVMEDCSFGTLVKTAKLTKPDQVIGTLLYVSPEQLFAQNVDERSDLYAVGLIAYELVTGRSARECTSIGGLIMETTRDFDAKKHPSRFIREMNSALERWILDLLEREPEKRIPNAREAIRRLQEILDAHRSSLSESGRKPKPTHVSVRPAPLKPTKPSNPARSGRRVAIAAGGVLAALVAMIFLFPSSQGNGGGGETPAAAVASSAEMPPPPPPPSATAIRPVRRTSLADLPSTDQRGYVMATTSVKRALDRSAGATCPIQAENALLFIANKYPDFPNPKYWIAECFTRKKWTEEAGRMRERYRALSGSDDEPSY
ncbi:serine/threonine protein kinase [Candidatus Uhrbacteria bacterium]|nr:serine/threonine protein kinase [Candidatus Uhrbacteria bacterium]